MFTPKQHPLTFFKTKKKKQRETKSKRKRKVLVET